MKMVLQNTTRTRTEIFGIHIEGVGGTKKICRHNRRSIDIAEHTVAKNDGGGRCPHCARMGVSKTVYRAGEMPRM